MTAGRSPWSRVGHPEPALATDLNAFNGTRTAEQGAAIAIRLATLPDDGPTGQLFDDSRVVPWWSAEVVPPARPPPADRLREAGTPPPGTASPSARAATQPMLLAPSIDSRMMSAWPAC